MFRPLVHSVRDNLRDTLRPLGISTEASVMVTEDERANPNCGQVFVGIFLADLLPNDRSGGILLATEFAIIVAVTFRTRFAPKDRRGEDVYVDMGNNKVLSMTEVALRIIQTIHGRYEIINEANAKAGRQVHYAELLNLARSIGKPEPVGRDHFALDPDTEDDGDPDSDYEGFLLQLYFQGATAFSSPYAIQALD